MPTKMTKAEAAKEKSKSTTKAKANANAKTKTARKTVVLDCIDLTRPASVYKALQPGRIRAGAKPDTPLAGQVSTALNDYNREITTVMRYRDEVLTAR